MQTYDFPGATERATCGVRVVSSDTNQCTVECTTNLTTRFRYDLLDWRGAVVQKGLVKSSALFSGETMSVSYGIQYEIYNYGLGACRT